MNKKSYRSERNRPESPPLINRHAAGIDIGSRFHVVAVPPDLCKEHVPEESGVLRTPDIKIASIPPAAEK
jgi:hypothetical protein